MHAAIFDDVSKFDNTFPKTKNRVASFQVPRRSGLFSPGSIEGPLLARLSGIVLNRRRDGLTTGIYNAAKMSWPLCVSPDGRSAGYWLHESLPTCRRVLRQINCLPMNFSQMGYSTVSERQRARPPRPV